MSMRDREQDHVAAGWLDDDHDLRWIEAGRLRVEEDDKGAVVHTRIIAPDAPDGAPIELYGPAWLSATELAGLVGHLAGWFAEDPTGTIRQIEQRAKYVRSELEAWNEWARIDEEHPPYEKLTNVLDALLADCRLLREDIGKFDKRAVGAAEEGAT